MHLERDVEDLQVEEDLEPTLPHLADHVRPLAKEEGHAHLHPSRLALKHPRDLVRAFAIAVERDDDCVASLVLS